MDKVVTLIQARSKSSRLPGKAFLPFNGVTILKHIVNQVWQSSAPPYVVVPFKDREIIDYLSSHCLVDFFTGSEDNVLDRFYQCAKLIQCDHIVRITADCPLLTADIIDTVVRAHLESRADYTANRLEEPKYPDGFDVEVFTFKALYRAWKVAMEPYNLEHVTPWIKQHSMTKAVLCPSELLPYKDVKLSVDTQEDYERILKWYEENKCLI